MCVLFVRTYSVPLPNNSTGFDVLTVALTASSRQPSSGIPFSVPVRAAPSFPHEACDLPAVVAAEGLSQLSCVDL